MLNGGLKPDDAITHLQASTNKIDLAAFGIQWILNPDFVNRLEKGTPLNGFDKLRYDKLYFSKYEGTEEEAREGYTDYPIAT